MIKNEYRKGLIEDLILSAETQFNNISTAKIKEAATDYVHSNEISMDDPVINHGKFAPAATNMLLKYGLINQQQVEDKITQAISK